jgi:23S rRNA (pseudouridine1915-N3)-methyltransferase
MKVGFWCIGKTTDEYIGEGVAVYRKRLVNYLSFEYKELTIPKVKIPGNVQVQQESERDEILKILKATDVLILLDEKGKELDSVGFSNFLQKLFNESGNTIIFLAGGAYGFHPDIYERTKNKLALSRMTFTHQMVRLIFTEQLYRAMTILKGEQYHH